MAVRPSNVKLPSTRGLKDEFALTDKKGSSLYSSSNRGSVGAGEGGKRSKKRSERAGAGAMHRTQYVETSPRSIGLIIATGDQAGRGRQILSINDYEMHQQQQHQRIFKKQVTPSNLINLAEQQHQMSHSGQLELKPTKSPGKNPLAATRNQLYQSASPADSKIVSPIREENKGRFRSNLHMTSKMTLRDSNLEVSDSIQKREVVLHDENSSNTGDFNRTMSIRDTNGGDASKLD